MVYTIDVPSEYGYVILTATLSTIVAHWHVIQVSRYRTAAKVSYPNAYASNAEAKEDKAKYLFNCAQRSHANFLEHQPTVLATLLIGGLRYPIMSAGLGLGWCAARVVYALGYVNKDRTNGNGRRVGNFHWVFELGLQFVAALGGYKMLQG